MLDQFKKFVMRGNVIELSIGVVLGAAFSKVVSSFTADVLMPPLGMLMGKVNFTELYINLSSQEYASLAEAKKAGAPTINYGIFINQLLDFTIVAFAIFVLLKALARTTGYDLLSKDEKK